MNDFFVKYVLFISMFQVLREKGVDVFIVEGTPNLNTHLGEGQRFLAFTIRPYDGVNLSLYLK